MEYVPLAFVSHLISDIILVPFWKVYTKCNIELFLSFDDLNITWLIVNVYEFK